MEDNREKNRENNATQKPDGAESETITQPVSVLIAHHHRLFREGLCRLLEEHPSLVLAATAGDGREALSLVQTLRPDVVLMGISMPQLNGIEATRIMKKISPRTQVLILSMHDKEEFLIHALEAGASGYLLMDTPAHELFQAIEEARRGNCYLSTSLLRTFITNYLESRKQQPDETLYSTLSGREREVLQLLVEGHSTQEISNILDITPRTVQTHRKLMMKKLKFHQFNDLVKYAVQMGIADGQPQRGHSEAPRFASTPNLYSVGT